jgi:peptide/nickel transport system substrate-binding protein
MKQRAGLSALAIVMLAIAACSSGSTSPPSGSAGPDQFVSGATFSMAVAGDPGNLDPATAVNGSTNLLLSFAYDTLVYSTKDSKIVPGLADKWTVHPKSVVFTLHKGATCSDGSAVTPSGVAKYINHVVDPKTSSPLLGVLIPADMSAAANDGAGTVTLQTKSPSPFLLQSAVAIFIVCGKGLTDPSILSKQTSGSGPYVLTQSAANDHYTLTARKGYSWGPNGSTTATKGVPSTVVLKIINNESTAANLLLTGGVNAALFSGPDRQRVESAPGVMTANVPAGTGEMFFNEDHGRPTSDPAVRQALAESVDIAALGKISSQNNGIKPISLASLEPHPCQVDSVSGHQPRFDPDAAKALLDRSGWTVGSGGVRAKNGTKLAVSILYASDQGAGQEAGAEYMAEAWKKIGVAATIRGAATTAFSDALFKTGDWDVVGVAIGLSLPSQFVGYVSGPPVPNGSNFAHIANSKYDALAKTAAVTPLSAGGCNVWAKAESALFDAYDVVPVVGETSLLASKGAEVTVVGGFAQPTLFRMLKG